MFGTEQFELNKSGLFFDESRVHWTISNKLAYYSLLILGRKSMVCPLNCSANNLEGGKVCLMAFKKNIFRFHW